MATIQVAVPGGYFNETGNRQAAAPGVGYFSETISPPQTFAGNAPATTTLTGALSYANLAITGTTTVVSALTGTIRRNRHISSATTATTALTGSIVHSTFTFAGATSVTTALTGHLNRNRHLIGRSSATTSLTGSLNKSRSAQFSAWWHRHNTATTPGHFTGRTTITTALVGSIVRTVGLSETTPADLTITSALSGTVIRNEALSGTTLATTALTATLIKKVGLQGTSVAVTGLAAPGFSGNTKVLSGTTTTTTAFTAAIIRNRHLGGNSSVATAFVGNIVATRKISGAARATTTLTGGLGLTRKLTGAAIAHTAMSAVGFAANTRSLAGNTNATSALAARLGRIRPLAGSNSLTTALSGAIKLAHNISGTTQITSVLTGNFIRNKHALAGPSSATTALIGTLTSRTQKTFAGATIATTSLTAPIRRTRKIIASNAATTALSGTLRQNRHLVGTAATATLLSGRFVRNRKVIGSTRAVTALSGALSVNIVTTNANLVLDCNTYNTANWNQFGSTNCTFTAGVVDPFGGTKAMQVAFPATVRMGYNQVLNPTLPAGSYTGSVYVKTPSAGTATPIYLGYYNNLGPMTQFSALITPTSTYQRISFGFTVATGDTAAIVVVNTNSDTGFGINGAVQISSLKVEAGTTLSPYAGCAVQPAPVVSNFAATANSATSTTLTPVVANGFTSLAVVSGPSHGSIIVNATNFTYISTAGYSGADSFTYTASNAGGVSNTATCSLTVVVIAGRQYMIGYRNQSETTLLSQIQGWLGTPLDIGSYTVQTNGFINNNGGVVPANTVMNVAFPFLSNWIGGGDGGNLLDMAVAASGGYDAAYRAMVNNIAAQPNPAASIALGWEMSGNWYPWSVGVGTNATASNYIATFRRIVPMIRAALPNTLIDFCYNWSSSATSYGPNTNPQNYWPGAGFVDVVTMDFYESNVGAGTGTAAWNVAQSGGFYNLDQLVQFAAANNVKLGLREYATGPGGGFGSAGGSNDGAWMAAAINWMNSLTPGTFIYQIFSSDAPADNIVPAGQNPAIQQAWITAWRGSKFAGTWWKGVAPP